MHARQSDHCTYPVQKREIALEILNYRKNGEKFWNLLSLMPVKDGCGNVVSFIGVQSDITELIRRKHAERELQQAKVSYLFFSSIIPGLYSFAAGTWQRPPACRQGI